MDYRATTSRFGQLRTTARVPFVAVLALAFWIPAQEAEAQSVDDVYYSASNCVVDDGGTGSDGTRWDWGRGGWYNNHNTSSVNLMCPIPYFREAGDLTPVRVRVSVEDRHNSTGGRVTAGPCSQTTYGNASCYIGNQVSTSVSFVGNAILDMTVTPTNSTRWLWLFVTLPDRDSNSGTSGVRGYRVLRE